MIRSTICRKSEIGRGDTETRGKRRSARTSSVSPVGCHLPQRGRLNSSDRLTAATSCYASVQFAMVALHRTDVLVTLLCSLRFHPHSLPPWKGGPLAVDEVTATGRVRLRPPSFGRSSQWHLLRFVCRYLLFAGLPPRSLPLWGRGDRLQWMRLRPLGALGCASQRGRQ